MDFSFYGSKYWKSLLKLGLVAYTLLVIWGMLFGLGRTVKESHHYNLVPFSTIIDYLHIWDVHTGASTMNVLGNIGIFVPFGFLIPLVFGGQWKIII